MFSFEGKRVEEVVLEKSDITKAELHFEPEDSYVRLILRPAKANEISEKLPDGEKNCGKRKL